MALRRIPGKAQQYHLIAYDKRGDELPDADGSSASEAALAELANPAADITDVFVLSHGWQGDYEDAISQYDRWVGAANPDGVGDGIRPFVIGLHWPSKAWSDRGIKSGSRGLLSGDDDDPDAMTVDEAVDEYAALLGGDDDVREALRTVLVHAASIDADEEASRSDDLPRDVRKAYRTLAESVGADGDDPLLSSGWEATDAFAAATAEQPGDSDEAGATGLLSGGGWFHKLREAVLTPLRQLTFWHGKNQAREFGENGAAQLLRAIQAATPARVHLMGHSFGTIVVSSAVRGPGATAVPPPRPVDSMFLVQGAVSLWAFSNAVPSSIGGGRGYLCDVVRDDFVAGPIVVTRSKWDYAVGRLYPLAVGVAGEYLLGDDLPKYGGIGAWGVQGVDGAVELEPLKKGATSADLVFAPGTVYNIDAQQVIATKEGIVGAHNDLAHPELVRLAWAAALSRDPGR